MIVSKCPLRISLIGGSTDLEEFIDSYGCGSVISFPCDLYTYIILFTDKNGLNHNSNKYVISYSEREEKESLLDIKNDVARECLSYFNCGPVNVNFTSDIFSHGSGLASSSSYIISLLKAISTKNKLRLSDLKICETALKIERKFNPLTGRQDPYGCGVSGFKKMEFYRDNKNEIKILDDTLLQSYDMYLIDTGIKRNSTNILKTLNLKEAESIVPLVQSVEEHINKNDYEEIFKIINESWKIKKSISNEIVNNRILIELDQAIERVKEIKCHKLCGAGGGGYFLIFSEKGANISNRIKKFNDNSFKIKLSQKGAHNLDI